MRAQCRDAWPRIESALSPWPLPMARHRSATSSFPEVCREPNTDRCPLESCRRHLLETGSGRSKTAHDRAATLMPEPAVRFPRHSKSPGYKSLLLFESAAHEKSQDESVAAKPIQGSYMQPNELRQLPVT